ncbi:MAG: TonB-dependent receptor [Novosphingobium sp.]|nr:TonB-dependent receptor [Novosphingobium sp.]
MKTNKLVRATLLASAASACIVAVAPAYAQDASSEEGDVIIVTGSRIARQDVDAPIPVAIISAETITEQGATNIQDILNELPQIGRGISRTSSNFQTAATGVSTVNLRNMGESRTLTLVNGRRFISGLAGDSAVDVNNIPVDFVERVDVITGGASAVYGSEAIAGVVNFVLKDKFEGISLRAQAGITSRGDNPRQSLSATAGTSFGADDRGNVMVNVTYDRDEGLLSRKRGRSDQDCFFNLTPDECGPATYSSYASQGRFELLNANGARTNVGGLGLFTFDKATNQLVAGFPTGSGYNRNAQRRIAVPVERWLASAVANYEIADSIKLFGEVTYSKVKSSGRIEAFPLDYTDIYDGSVGNLGIPITNAYIPASVQAAIAAANSDADPTNDVAALGFRRRQVEVVDRSNNAERDTWRATVGVKGDLSDKINFEVSYVYGYVNDYNYSQDIDNARYRQALDSIVLNGQIVCRDPAARAAGCAPINLFGQNTVSPEAAAWVESQVPASEDITNQQHVVSASIAGSLFDLPAGPLGFAIGAEYRKEKSVDDLDILTNTGGNAGNMIPDTRGSFDVKEIYGEVEIPLLSGTAFAERLSVRGAARLSDYSTIGSVFSWSAGLEWAPVSDVRLRAAYAEANRAPNISELFSAPSEDFPTGLTDPCDGITAATSGPIATACRAIPGVNATIAASPDGTFFYELADIQGINGFEGGNINLKEETAKTLTIGGVFTPSFIPNLSLTIDYFNIKVDNAIDVTPRQTSIDECINTGLPDFCDNVIRSAATGRLLTINSQLSNIAKLKTEGIDFGLNYRSPLGLFQDDMFSVNILYTYLMALEKQAFIGAPLEENRGQLADGQRDDRLGDGFKHKATANFGYKMGSFKLNWQVNYLGKIVDTIGGYDDVDLDKLNSIGAKIYNDIRLGWTIEDTRTIEFYFGVDNLFDVDPPFLPSGFFSNVTGTETAAGTYDPFGRRLYAGVNVKF